MKRALIITLFALTSCQPTFLEAGRYACERDQPDQCPGKWRCGLEGYCHQIGNTLVAWRCEIDDDCEGGFHCGMSKTSEFRECHDPTKPQDWPCEVPSDCVADWSCGLTSSGDGRQCHDPSAPQAWPCEQPSDCLGGWTCGLTVGRDARQCHDPATPKSWPCDVSADCVAGWSCGLATGGELHECHDPQNPRAWTCFEDSDCLGGWRCGTESVCVDPSADALGQLVLAELDGGAHLNSLGTKTPITRLTVSPIYTEGRGRGRANLAYVQDGHLRAMTLDLASGAVTRHDLGTELPTAMIAQGARGTNYTSHLNDEVPRLAALWPDGGLTEFSFDTSSFSRRDYANDDLAPFDLLGQGTTTGDLTPSTLFISSAPDDFYYRLRGEDLTFNGIPEVILTEQPWPNFGTIQGNRFHSITSLRHTVAQECVYVVDNRGLWVSQRGGPEGAINIDDYNFEPVSLDPYGHASCTNTMGPQIRSVTSVGDRWLAVTASTANGPTQVGVLDAERTWINNGFGDIEIFCGSTDYRPCDSDDRVRVDLAFGPCVACTTGATFKGLSTVITAPDQAPAIEVSCGQPGVPDVVYRLSQTAGSTQCTRTLVSGGSSYFSAEATAPLQPAPGVVAWSGPAGQLWFGNDSANIADISFDRAATGVVRTGPGANQFIAFTPQLLGTPSPIGLGSTRSTQLSASVANVPTLAIASGLMIDLAGASAVSGGRTTGFLTSNNLGSPVSAVVTRSPFGTRIAVVTTGTTLSAGDASQALDGGAAVSLSPRLTTLEPIASISFPKEHTPASAGPLVTGYAILGSGVARVVAESLTRWRTEAVQLPPTLQPIETWFQGTKGRVGFHDGSVFSLPSRVRISDPLPGSEVVDFAQTCGQQLALTRAGLFRLEADASGPVGHWVQLPLPSQLANVDFADGRVHGVGNEVFVFTRMGEAARITFASCPE